MVTLYESGKAIKFTEEDIYLEGCIPETSRSYEVDIEFEADTLEELLTQIKEFYGVTDEHLELNSCGENGRIDISILEDDYSYQASESDIALWKQGKKRLWNSIYTYYIQKVKREAVIF